MLETAAAEIEKVTDCGYKRWYGCSATMRSLQAVITQSEALPYLIHPVVLDVEIVHEDIFGFRTIGDRVGIYRIIVRRGKEVSNGY